MFLSQNILLVWREEADALVASNEKMQTSSFQHHFQFHVGMVARTGSQNDFTEYKLVSIMWKNKGVDVLVAYDRTMTLHL
jgi:hypothetical protein